MRWPSKPKQSPFNMTSIEHFIMSKRGRQESSAQTAIKSDNVANDSPISADAAPIDITPPINGVATPIVIVPVLTSEPQSPPAIAPHIPALPASSMAPVPLSPASNRERFRSACMPAHVTCDLSTASTEPGLRFSFQAIVLVVYPSSQNPLRRHVLLGDGRGTVGVTVWNSHVNAFSFSVIGQLVHLTKVAITVHNNVRGIVLNKESILSFSEGNGHFAQSWWSNMILVPPISVIHVADAKDNDIINVAGVLGAIHVETKNVRQDAKELLTLRIIDRTGILQVRSWNHTASLFQPKLDQPILIHRVRVSSFGGMKIGELLDGNGSIVHEGDFPAAADLAKFWSE